MNKSKVDLSMSSLVFAVCPWVYPIFAELMTPAMAMLVAPAAYVSCLTSFVMAVIAIVKRTGQNLPLASIALVLNALFIAFAVYSALITARL